jgi:hypothetical protein
MADIRVAMSEEERLAVYRFRHMIYCGEMGFDEKYADHERKIIKDELDGPEAMLLVAWDGDQVVGTTRTNLVRRGGIRNYLEYYRLTDRPLSELTDTSISTRIMIHPRFRRTPLTVRLTCDCYQWMLEQGVKTDYCDCEPEVVPFFTGLGYKEICNDFLHPALGGMGSILRLDTHDLDHLTQVRSPLRRVLTRWQAVRQTAESVDV